MKPENEMTEEVRQLLKSLEEHGKNARRQQQLSELMDGLSEEEQGATTSLRGGTTKQSNLTRTKTVQVGLSPEGDELRLLSSARNDGQRRLYPIWWVIGAAAAVLLLWLMIKPTAKETPNMNEKILVEKTTPVDSVKDEVEEVILEEPIIVPVIASEAKQSNLTQTDIIQVGLSPEGDELRLPRRCAPRNDVTEVIPMESTETIENTDSVNNEINPIPPVSETPLTLQSPQRRVIRSLNLVCYECQTENGEWEVENGKWKVENSQLSTFNFPLSTQAWDPNMKNGAMTFELKLN